MNTELYFVLQYFNFIQFHCYNRYNKIIKIDFAQKKKKKTI